MLIHWHDLHLRFPDKEVLSGVSLTINPGDRIGLVGENGAGKTCLFRIAMGELTPDEGEVYLAQGLRIGYLTQSLLDADPEAEQQTCWESATAPFQELIRLEQELTRLAQRLETTFGDEARVYLDRLGEVQDRFEQQGGYTFRTRVEATLMGLGLTQDMWDHPVPTLSAGQKVRLALARLLLSDYDVLLLDEPTNHLDISAREWLQEHLRSIETPYIVVSHDRTFLDGVVDKVGHLDRGKLTVYSGNYSAFRAQMEGEAAQAWQVYEKRQKMVRKLEAQARKYETWSNRTEKSKIGAYDKGFVGHRAAKLMKRSIQARRRLERTMEEMKAEKPYVKDGIAIEFHASTAKRLMRVEELVVGYDPERPLGEPLTFDLKPGDRLALVGPNGCGKSTVLRTVLGERPPLRGTVWRSSALDVGYFDQDARSMPTDTPALQAVLDVEQDETLARTVMGRMRIRRESVTKPVGALSAGERAKVLLARLILGKHNLLVLDEPTNHLDIETQDVLLEALAAYPGGILFVSHDRHFVQVLATEVLHLGDS